MRVGSILGDREKDTIDGVVFNSSVDLGVGKVDNVTSYKCPSILNGYNAI